MRGGRVGEVRCFERNKDVLDEIVTKGREFGEGKGGWRGWWGGWGLGEEEGSLAWGQGPLDGDSQWGQDLDRVA